MAKIETIEQYEWAVRRVEELLPMVKDDTPADDPHSIELELLSNMLADYSDEHFAIGSPTLAETLKLRMQERGLSPLSVSKMLGVSPSRISE